MPQTLGTVNSTTSVALSTDVSPQVSVTAGENVSAGDAIAYSSGLQIDCNATGNANGIGNLSWRGNSFTPSISFDLTKISVSLLYNSGTANDLTLEIYATSAGLPTGSALASKTISAISNTSYEMVDFILTTPLSVTASTVYAYTIKSATSSDNTYFQEMQLTSVYAGGNYVYSTDGGSTFGQQTGYDCNFEVYAAAAYLKSDASDANKINFVGFASETVTSGNPININTAGTDDNQSGLTLGAEYYLSDTAGAISTTPGTTSIKVGKALSATEIEIYTGGEAVNNSYVLINTYDLTSVASVTIPLSSTYKSFKITGSIAPATDGVRLYGELFTDGGTTPVNVDYIHTYMTAGSPTTVSASGSSSSSTGRFSQKTIDSSIVGSLHIDIADPAIANGAISFMYNYGDNDGQRGFAQGIIAMEAATTTTGMNAIKIYFSSGNIASGELRLLGLQ